MSRAFEAARGLQWMHLESVHLVQQELALEGPGALGSLLRSVMGLALHQIDPQTAELFLGRGDDTDQTRPWWMWPQEPADGAQFCAGDEMRVRWSLCVWALPHLPALAQALQHLGQLGLGRQRAKADLVSLQVLSPHGALPFAQACHTDALWDTGLLWQLASQEAEQALRAGPDAAGEADIRLWVRAHTPLRIKRAGELVFQAPVLSTLVAATMGRMDALYRHSPDANNLPDSSLPWLQRQLWLQWSDRFMPIDAMTDEVAVSRWSSRQRRSMTLPGLRGTWIYAAEAALAVPWLRLAEHLQLGGKTSFGMGALQVELVKESRSSDQREGRTHDTSACLVV